MTTEQQCSKGWGARCAIAKGKRCRCKCGGENHNTVKRQSAPPFDITETPLKSRGHWEIDEESISKVWVVEVQS